MLDAGIPVCQRAAAGLGMNDLRIKWSNQPYSVEDCFNIMFPHDYFNHVIDLTNVNLPVSVRNFTKHEFMQCIGELLTTALFNPGNIKNLWNTQEIKLVPPFRMKERFGLGRDRFQDWKAYPNWLCREEEKMLKKIHGILSRQWWIHLMSAGKPI